MNYDTSDPVQVKEKKTKAQLKKEQELEELKVLLIQKPFRDWVWRLLEYAKMFNTTANLDPHSMAIASGKRDVGLRIFGEILEADQHALVTMLGENKDNG